MEAKIFSNEFDSQSEIESIEIGSLHVGDRLTINTPVRRVMLEVLSEEEGLPYVNYLTSKKDNKTVEATRSRSVTRNFRLMGSCSRISVEGGVTHVIEPVVGTIFVGKHIWFEVEDSDRKRLESDVTGPVEKISYQPAAAVL